MALAQALWEQEESLQRGRVVLCTVGWQYIKQFIGHRWLYPTPSLADQHPAWSACLVPVTISYAQAHRILQPDYICQLSYLCQSTMIHILSCMSTLNTTIEIRLNVSMSPLYCCMGLCYARIRLAYKTHSNDTFNPPVNCTASCQSPVLHLLL